MIKRLLLLLMTTTMAVVGARAQLNPFTVSLSLKGDRIEVTAEVPENHYLYAEDFRVLDGAGTPLPALMLPESHMHPDPVSGDPIPVYDESFKASYAWKPSPGGEAMAVVRYLGCSEDGVCFPPGKEELRFSDSAAESADVRALAVSGDWKTALEKFTLAGRAEGFMRPSRFLEFLDQAESGPLEGETVAEDSGSLLARRGILLMILFILVGGLALNLTPCVLPMIPVNLAIIGAGAQAGSKGRGFALGAAYGLGIALAYGLLGVVVVLTGANFGSLQSSPWFNLVIALIFIALALAMFDVIQIDFSRFQSKLGGDTNKSGSFVMAFTMGVIAALLAGACVAPVVTTVVLFSAELYQTSRIGGLLLPFVLGIGMALPWPFAGAGLSFLPKPGKWMQYVKVAFGVGILILAFNYGLLSYRGFRPVEVKDGIDGRTNAGFARALERAHAEGKSVLIDVTASWCKNCKAMEKNTFPDEEVKKRLGDYVFLKYVSEDPENPNTQAVWEHFGVQGPPAYYVLKPIR